MHTVAPSSPPQAMPHIFFCLDGNPDCQLTLYLNQRTRQPNKHTFKHSSCRKHKDIARHGSKGPLTTEENGDRVLIRNLPEKGKK